MIAGEQYQSLQKITGNFATYAARARYWDRHPRVRPTDAQSASKWWQYAGGIVREQFQPQMTWADVQQACVPQTPISSACEPVSKFRLEHRCEAVTTTNYVQVGWMRRKYIPAYVECLQNNQMGGNEETRKMDQDLPEATILLFRRLAHTEVRMVYVSHT